MPYTRCGRSLANDNIAVGQAQNNTEKISGADGTPTDPVEDVTLNNIWPRGIEKIAIGVTGPNPEVP